MLLPFFSMITTLDFIILHKPCGRSKGERLTSGTSKYFEHILVSRNRIGTSVCNTKEAKELNTFIRIMMETMVCPFGKKEEKTTSGEQYNLKFEQSYKLAKKRIRTYLSAVERL